MALTIRDETRVLDGPYDMQPNSVSPDGEWLVYHRNDPKTRGGIWRLPLKGGGTPRVIVDTPANEEYGIVSPDGRWLAYGSDETGRDEIYVQAFPGGGNRVQVSLNGGTYARWSRDGRQLYFREGKKLMAVSVERDSFGRPSMLFEAPLIGYDVADGRFLAVLRDATVPQAPVNVVLNWHDELKRLAPGN